MTQEDVRARLLAERARLSDVHVAATRLHGTDDGVEMAAESLPSEMASLTIDRELDESVAQHAVSELDEIEAALKRLDDGKYGTCEECGKAIPEARLEIQPAARFCVDDQARMERSR